MTLTIRRKAHRALMAQMLVNAAGQVDDAFVTKKGPVGDLYVAVSLGGVTATTSLRGASRNRETLVLSWNTERRFKPHLCFASVNQYHGCKATTCGDIYDVCGAMREGFDAVRNEAIFLPAAS